MSDDFYSCAGERFETIYSPEIAKDGTIKLVPTGKRDLVEYYNSQRDSCDPNKIAAQYLAGDASVIERGKPVFMDLLDAPKTLAEAFELNFKAQNLFESLPADIRSKFDNSYYKFVNSAGSDEWNSIFFPKSESVVKESDSVEE